MDTEEKRGSDEPVWYCSFCDAANKEGQNTCGNCGESRENSEEKYYIAMRRERLMAEKDCFILTEAPGAKDNTACADTAKSPEKKAIRGIIRSALSHLKKGKNT